MKTHLERVRDFPCIVPSCGKHPVAAHHVVGGTIFVRIGPRGRHKHSDYLALPLCHDHHQGANGIHTLGVDTWESRFGFQSHMIDRFGKMLGLDLWKAARDEFDRKRASRRAKRSSKLLPRRFT